MVTADENRSPNTSRLLILAGVLFVVGVLLGFIPEYLRASRFDNELHARDQTIDHLQREQKLSSIRDLASSMYLEATRKNYGIAARHATAFFDGVRSLLNETSSPSLKSALESILAQRDSIVAKIAKGDSSVESTLRDVLDKLHQVAVS